jgi:hypothetical protein
LDPLKPQFLLLLLLSGQHNGQSHEPCWGFWAGWLCWLRVLGTICCWGW